MAQILDPLPYNSPGRVLCCYVNATSNIQIARISNVPNWYFERVVFPGQRLVFEAIPEALLEIHTGKMASSILSDKIPCDRLQIDQELPAIDEVHPSAAAIAYHERVTGRSSGAKPSVLTTPALSSID
ncbi:DUF1830 domain-containing protein [Arthrospira platensis]|jgi:hypothetical protein|uniref:DUF1830 domain-containing protein n=1 Tax=Limnospira platensis NIES-46 TaxID=1236695 RepID=A0A5M3T4P7_LIMPL|nr:DUF1830 domain-containing protein [Arthrospira platensis]AMW27457.1 hypothetical protein AP285_05150 [Arthrospira platensis YZ]MBD2668043.1 DUF1830 domain-containing protein [Arthrospira platensis FACHB-439]MBD2711998.1 DUF1830 domain-containing protein [Arthrospira platensis FACHB-835]MDF2210962.1 DUF1830 domain-containing protein [Arthrospira platensis NCB002]MDT9185040.1 DUF1830 domain-containing protein [Limnospira sp. PMC 289.06]MDT9297264.1 DUF1830 domain-containing protein [Arthrosp